MTTQVLLVDDDLVLCRALSRLLRSAGYVVTVAIDVPTALEIIEEESPAMLLTDHWLGHDTGLQLALTVRERWPALPVVLMSGALSGDTQSVARMLQVRTCLRKPISRTELLAVVSDTIGAPAGVRW